jgi:DnaJ-class molecular chaperone
MNPINNKIYYDILNIEPNSDSETIKKAYRRLSFKYHPDKNNNDSVMFNKITQAFEFLIQNHSSNIPSDNSSSIEIYNPPTNDPNNEDIITNLNITFEDSYNGANVPINIKRSIFNNNIFKYEEEKIYIPLPKSIDNNEIITINNKGNCINYKYSDIKIIIKLKEHASFMRDGLNLIYFSNITFKESLIGVDFNITHLNNKMYRITNTNREIINSNTNIILRNLGFQRDSFTGNLIIKFKIDYPKTLSLETIQKLKEIL